MILYIFIFSYFNDFFYNSLFVLSSEQCPDEQPLPSESEEELVMCLKTTEWGKIATKTDVLNLVALYVMENKGGISL